jgi:hypothetical protein
MASLRFLYAFFPLLGGAAACAPVALAEFNTDVGGGSYTSVVSGTGGYGASLSQDSGSSTGAGGESSGSGGGTKGTPALPPINGSYSYLCGDSSSVCMPGTAIDECAPGGNTNPNSSPDGSANTCQLVPHGAQTKGQCSMSGFGTDGAACSTVADCAAGFGCVVSPYPGVGNCRAYCCQDLESCPSGQYCAPTPINGTDEPVVPACVPATHCHLLGNDCPSGTACSIVRMDGTTTCTVPGTGVAGDACTGSAGPCAAGYTCSPATGTCLELCHTNGGTECGPGGTCQGGTAPFPDGIGFCVF